MVGLKFNKFSQGRKPSRSYFKIERLVGVDNQGKYINPAYCNNFFILVKSSEKEDGPYYPKFTYNYYLIKDDLSGWMASDDSEIQIHSWYDIIRLNEIDCKIIQKLLNAYLLNQYVPQRSTDLVAYSI